MKASELQVGAWYHFWSTTVQQGVMDYGQLVELLDDGRSCRFKNAVVTVTVPLRFVVESAPPVTEGRIDGGSVRGPLVEPA